MRINLTTCFAVLISTFAPAAAAYGATGQEIGGAGSPQRRSAYVLGAGDQFALRVPDAEELSDKPVRVDENGYVRLPMIDRVRAGGLTIEELEAELVTRLKPFVRKPEVSVVVLEYRSQPVSVIGSVKAPGVHQLQGRKTLIEVLALAGGLSDDAGYTIKVTREIEWGQVPLPGATDDPTGKYSVADVRIKSLVGAERPEQNIIVLPHDVIAVPRAELIYVAGQVMRSGGFVLAEKESMSVLQALSLAGGVGPAAASQNSRIIRGRGPSRVEIPVDLKKVLAGKGEDVALKPDDILFVPDSAPKKAAARAMEAAIQMATGVVIWRR